ncbi:hypothetical protein [Mesorhizobium comanense]|uniref:hypothetical protein n=1 Tax=Mesorhizobium comanense TaxID=2502215 RepID=UPI0010F9B7D5|nr:hypothetical protein [Mesorhizobium comanense]
MTWTIGCLLPGGVQAQGSGDRGMAGSQARCRVAGSDRRLLERSGAPAGVAGEAQGGTAACRSLLPDGARREARYAG